MEDHGVSRLVEKKSAILRAAIVLAGLGLAYAITAAFLIELIDGHEGTRFKLQQALGPNPSLYDRLAFLHLRISFYVLMVLPLLHYAALRPGNRLAEQPRSYGAAVAGSTVLVLVMIAVNLPLWSVVRLEHWFYIAPGVGVVAFLIGSLVLSRPTENQPYLIVFGLVLSSILLIRAVYWTVLLL